MKVILLMAATADGVIARHSGQLVDWTGKADKQYFVEVTRSAGVVIMGSKTFDTIQKALPGRKNIVMTRDKTRKSCDPDLVFTDQTPDQIVDDLKKQGYHSVALIGGARINSLFAENSLIDEIHLTVAPKIFGRGLTLFNQSLDMDLHLIQVKEIGQGHILATYEVAG